MPLVKLRWKTIKRLMSGLSGLALSWLMSWMLPLLLALPLTLVSLPGLALMDSAGENGIDAYRLQDAPYSLTGRKIAIGQVEIGRPALFGLDKAAVNNRSLHIGRLFTGESVATANEGVDDHAARVASIMVSRDKTVRGVAPDAILYSAGVGSEQRSGQTQECLASQTIALQNGGDVRAINFSFGESLNRDPRPDAVLDGNALLTQCVDWSARVHNVLYSISGNQGRGGFPIPTDTFNGMTIANSMPIDGKFTKVDFFSLGSTPTMVIGRDPATERNVGDRRSVVLVAPGRAITTLAPDGTVTAPDTGGTSFASPHVTATLALLQEFGDASIRKALKDKSIQHWGLEARRQEVMKAVLMNSADKVQDRGDGLRLGMSRTLLDLGNKSWLESDAYADPEIPLDAQMGTGHLNAYRAYQQFSPGEWSDEQPVPAIAWDFNQVGNAEDMPKYRDYLFEQPLQQGSAIAATLAWNRRVELTDRNGNEAFDAGETFEDKGLNDLNLYLMPADASRTSKSLTASVSKVDSVEHIFYSIPSTGRYKLRVVYGDRVNEPTQDYALAWWAKPS